MQISIRLIENPSRRMQRLGFLKFLIARAAKSATSNIRTLGEALITTVAKKVQMTPTPELEEYLNITLTTRADKSLPVKVKKTTEHNEKGSMVLVQLQDAYLSSKELPSQRGRLVPRDSTNYPRLATGLGLLRKDSFALLVRGQVLLQLVSFDELNAFKKYSTVINPLVITQSQKLFFLFTLLEHDEHIMLPLLRSLLDHPGQFADWEAGNMLPEIIRAVCHRFRSSVRSGTDAVRLQRLLDTANVIEQWKGKPYKGTGARDEAATVRLEPLVDLGILAKEDHFRYRYGFTSIGRRLMSELTVDENEGAHLNRVFFSKVVNAFDLDLMEFSGNDGSLYFIYQSYSKLASPLGYAPIHEVLLLGTILAIEAGKGYFEIDNGLEILKELQQQYPNVVRFNVDRMGNLNFVKFTGNPLHTDSS